MPKNHRSPKPQVPKTTGPQNHRSPKPQVPKTTGPQNHNTQTLVIPNRFSGEESASPVHKLDPLSS